MNCVKWTAGNHPRYTTAHPSHTPLSVQATIEIQSATLCPPLPAYRQQTNENQTGSPLQQQQISSSSGTTDDNNPSLHNDQENPNPPAAGPSFAKLKLEGQDEVLDVVACAAPAGLFEVRSERHSHVILASGVSPALAFYPIGSESRYFGLASIAWAVASRVTSLTVGALDGLFGFVGLRGRGKKAVGGVRSKAQGRRANGGGGGEEKDGGGDDPSPAPLVLHWDGGLQDGWRRVSRLFLGPSGRLAAAADGFGRVMLVDCATRQVCLSTFSKGEGNNLFLRLRNIFVLCLGLDGYFDFLVPASTIPAPVSVPARARCRRGGLSWSLRQPVLPFRSHF